MNADFGRAWPTLFLHLCCSAVFQYLVGFISCTFVYFHFSTLCTCMLAHSEHYYTPDEDSLLI